MVQRVKKYKINSVNKRGGAAYFFCSIRTGTLCARLMKELVESIKKAREEKGLSLEEIQEETRIRLKHLQAIEAGELDKLPGEFYRRAFLAGFAAQVGLDSQEILDRYTRLQGGKGKAPAVEENPEYLHRELAAAGPSRSRFFWPVCLGIILFLLLAVGAAYYFQWPAALFPAAGEEPTVAGEMSGPALESGENTRDTGIPGRSGEEMTMEFPVSTGL